MKTKQAKRTEPKPEPSPEPDFRNPSEILEPLRQHAKRRIATWQQTAASDPLRALEWQTREAVEAVTMLEAVDSCERVIASGATSAALRQHALDMCARFARFPPASTGLLDATIAANRAAAWILGRDEALDAAASAIVGREPNHGRDTRTMG